MDKQIHITWPKEKNGSLLTFTKWAKIHLLPEDHAKFLAAFDCHQKIVTEAIINGDAVNLSSPQEVNIQWKNQDIHQEYMLMIPESDTKIWHDVVNAYWGWVAENYNPAQYTNKNC